MDPKSDKILRRRTYQMTFEDTEKLIRQKRREGFTGSIRQNFGQGGLTSVEIEEKISSWELDNSPTVRVGCKKDSI